MGRYPGRNHVGNFWWRSIKGLDVAMGRISLFPIDLRRRPYNTIALRASVWSPFVQKVQTLKKNNKRNDTNYN